MPDFNKLIQGYKEQRNTNIVNPEDDGTAEGVIRKRKALQEALQARKQPKFTGNSDNINDINNPETMDRRAEVKRVQEQAPDTIYNSYVPETDPNAKSVDYAYEDWASKFGKSLAVGTGEVVKGWGDVLQFATSLGYTTGDGWEDNPLQALGKYIEDANALDTNTDFSNPDLSLGDLISNPEFWTTQFPKVFPQLADAILIGKGASKGVGVLEKGAAKLLTKEVAEEGAETLAKKFVSNSGKSLKATTEGVYEGAAKVNEYAGTGASRLSRILNDQGKFTKTFREIADNSASGVLMNLKVGLQNGTEIYNTYSNLKDKNGENLFTADESAQMARNTALNNLMYAGVDIASYGVVFGKTNGLGAAVRGSSNGLLSKAGKMFAESQKYLPGRLAQLGGKMAFEGVEESFQESFEEWSKMKAYHDVKGSLKGYEGNVPAQFKNSKDLSLFGDFFEFYSSDENKTTRNLSGALGALMGGSMDLKHVVNKSANDTYNMYSRVENLSKRFEAGTEGAEFRDYHIRGTMNEMIMQNKEEAFVDYLSRLKKNNVVTDEEYGYYEEVFDKMATKANEVRNINSLSGKVAYMTNYGEEMAYMDKLEIARKKYEENVEFHKNNISDPINLKAAIEKEYNAFTDTADNLSKLVVVAQENQQQLLAGKSASQLETRIISTGSEPHTVLDEEKTLKGASQEYVRNYKRNSKLRYEEYLASVQNEQNDKQEELKTKATETFDSIVEAVNPKNKGSLANKFMNFSTETYGSAKEIFNKKFNELKTNLEEKTATKQAEAEANGINLEEDNQEESETTFEINNDEEFKDKAIDIYNRMMNGGVVTDEEIKFTSDNQEKFGDLVMAESVLQNAVSKLKNNEVLNDADYQTISANKKRFSELAEIASLTNSEQLLKEAIESETDGLTDAEKQFINEASQRNSDQNQKDKEKDDLKKKRSQSEFNKNNDSDISANKSNSSNKNNNNSSPSNPNARFKLDENTQEQNQQEQNQDEEEIIVPERKENETIEETKTRLDAKKRKALQDAGKVYDKTSNVVKKAISSFLKSTKKDYKSFKEKSGKSMSSAVSTVDDINPLRYDHRTLSQMVTVDSMLNQMYPNSNVNVVIANDLKKIIGVPALGMALHGTIYIDEKAWKKNDRTFFHELAHINFALSKEETATKQLISELVKNKGLVNEITKQYDNQIQYDILDDGNGGSIPAGDFAKTKGQIISSISKQQNRKISKEESENILSELEKEGKIKKRELIDQEIIIDELFAANMELFMENNLKNKYLERKTNQEIQAEEDIKNGVDRRSWLRKTAEKYTGVSMLRSITKSIKKWIDFIKGKGQELFDNDQITDGLITNHIDNLTNQEGVKFYDLKDEVMSTFLNGGPDNFINPSARFKLIEESEQEEENHKSEIREKIKDSSKIITEKDQKEIVQNINNDETLKSERFENDFTENSIESYVQDELFNHDRLASLKKTSGLIKKFSQIYNKALRKHYILNKKSDTKWNIPVFNGDDLMVDLYSLSGNSNSAVDFIYELENSANDRLFEFNKFMDLTRSDKYSFLNSFWMISKDVAVVDSVQTYVSKDGKIEVQSAMNMREKADYDRAYESVLKTFKTFRDFVGKQKLSKTDNIPDYLKQHFVSKYDKFNTSVKNIQRDNFTNEDLYNVVQFFGGNMNNFKENSIFIDGRRRPLDAVTVAMAKALGPNDNIMNVSSKGSTTKPEIVKYIRGLIVSNRKNTSDFTVMNAEGNQVPARQVKGHINRKLEQINKDAKVLSEKQFIDKYTTTKGTGLYSNGLLKYWYKSINKGNTIDVTQNLGIKNDKDSNYSDFAKNNSNDNSLNEFFAFLSSNNKGTYMMETGRYSDSPISYMMEVPTHKIDDFGSFSEKGFNFNAKQSKYFTYLGNVYNSFHKNKSSLDDIKTQLEKSINDEISGFMNENKDALTTMPQIRDMVDQNGNLNQNGKKAVASYVLNTWINSTQFNEIFLPDISADDNLKRAKSLRSPGFSFKNLFFEPIYFKDDLDANKNELDDGGMYILKEDAERIEQAFGNVMAVGKGYKLLHSGMEQNNPMFKGRNFYNKGYTTILDEEYVLQNPRLIGLYDAMINRRKKYIKQYGEINQSLTDGQPTYMPIAIPFSANKVSGPNGELNVDAAYNQDGDFTLDDYNQNAYDEDSHIYKALDRMSWKGDQYFGMDGENLILQQNMDKKRTEINTPVQMVKAIITNGSVDGKLEELENIQNLLSELEQEQLSEISEVLNNGSSKDVLELFKKYIDDDNIDNLQKYLLDDGLSINTPAIRTLAINTFLNQIKQNGNKLRTPGTIAQQKPAKYHKNILINNKRYYVSTGGSEGLNFYKKDSITGGNKPGEAVVPGYLKSKLVPRQYRLFEESKNSNLIEVAVPTNQIEIASAAKSYAQGVMSEGKRSGRINSEMDIDTFIAEYNVQNENGKIIGFYIPGDNFMATRIPAHGPQSTGFFEVVDFDTTESSQIQLPPEFALNITGGDFDGDQVFMQYKGGDKAKWNQVYDGLKNHWLSAEMDREVRLPIDFKEEAKNAIEQINKKIGSDNEQKLMFTPEYRRKSFNDTLISKNNVGAAANYHSYLGMLAAYDTEFDKQITIDGESKSKFEDSSSSSRTIDSAKILNIILDNAKYGFADSLGINEHTVGDALILINLGYDLIQVGTILNSDVYKDHNKSNAGKRNTFSPAENTKELNSTSEIKINTNEINSKENALPLESLISYISKIKSDMSDISSIMGGHNRIENDPFILTEQIKNIEKLLNNEKDNQVLVVSDKLKNNPMLQNYLKTAKEALKMQEQFDPVSRTDFKEIYGNLVNDTTKNINNNQKRKLHEDLERAATSRLLGFNNIEQSYKDSLTRKGDKNNIFSKIAAIVETKKSKVVGGNSIATMISEYDTSLLFSKVLAFSDGNNPYISLRSSFFNENLTDQERDMAKEEFRQLDGNLKKDLMIYDLMTNGWKGRKSLFHLMDLDFTKEVSKYSDQDMKLKDKTPFNDYVKTMIEVSAAELNQSLFPTMMYQPFIRTSEGLILNERFFNSQPKYDDNRIWNKIKSGKPVSFFYYDRSSDTKYFMKYKGFSDADKLELKRSKLKFNSKQYFDKINEMMPRMVNDGSLISIKVKNDRKDSIDYSGITSIQDSSTNIPTDPFKLSKNEKQNKEETFLDWLGVVKDTNTNSDARFKLDDWYNYDEELDRSSFDRVMEFEPFIEEKTKNATYREYLSEKKNSNEAYKNVNEDSVKEMTQEQLMSHFNDFGQKNKYAYANVMKPIVMELANRISLQQTKDYTGVLADGKDISQVQKWLMANNIPSNHPMIQGLVRNIENQYKEFGQQKHIYQIKLQEKTNNLYKEQLDYLIAGGSFKDKLKALWDYMFANKEELYNKLYGPLVTYDSVQKTDRTGKSYEMKIMKYKTSEEVEQAFKDGTISNAQYEFYKATSEIANELGSFSDFGKRGKRADYIPHVAPGQMEAFSRRGLLGLMVSSKTIDERIKDVKMDFINPSNGQVIKNATFADIDFMYSLATSKGDTNAKPKDYYNYKLKAIKLLKKGVNEDGSPIKLSEIDMGTVIGDTFVNRFTKSGSQKSNHFQSLDLNKAFGDYIHTSLWTNGNDKFAGMKKMLPIIDGALAILDKGGQKRMSSYVDKVWKQNFLQGAKQDKLKTPAHLEAFGITTDKAIDYITRGSLIYWLGYKGLAIGGGLYAVGNILNGKFNNIANQGGKDWLKGERRFWTGKTGGFNLMDPLRGVRESSQILKKLGFMDINIFDDISVNQKSSLGNFFMNMALWPMTYSEKWIQGVHFLGMLKDDEWNKILSDDVNPISSERMNEMENKVKLSHGKGYQSTDQRMIQMYSWGRLMMQFSRHIPTVVYNNFGKKDLNNYGKVEVGAYRQVYNTIQDVVTGKVSPKDFIQYYKGLDSEERKKLNSGLMGFGILATAGALGTIGADNKYVNDLASDVNIFFDTERVGSKLSAPPALGMIGQLIN